MQCLCAAPTCESESKSRRAQLWANEEEEAERVGSARARCAPTPSTATNAGRLVVSASIGLVCLAGARRSWASRAACARFEGRKGGGASTVPSQHTDDGRRRRESRLCGLEGDAKAQARTRATQHDDPERKAPPELPKHERQRALGILPSSFSRCCAPARACATMALEHAWKPT